MSYRFIIFIGRDDVGGIDIHGKSDVLKYMGDDGVAAFGIACYYTPFFFNIGNAIAQSAQPIISYNYGIARWNKVDQARRLLFSTSLCSGIIVMSLFRDIQ